MWSWLSTRLQPTQSAIRYLVFGTFLGFSLSLTSTSLALYVQARRRARINDKLSQESRPIELRSDEVLSGVTGLIGALHSCFFPIQAF